MKIKYVRKLRLRLALTSLNQWAETESPKEERASAAVTSLPKRSMCGIYIFI